MTYEVYKQYETYNERGKLNMRGNRIPVQKTQSFVKENGTIATRELNSYVAVLTEKDGSEVKAVRICTANKKGNALNDEIKENYPDWNIKYVAKLYDSDFDN